MKGILAVLLRAKEMATKAEQPPVVAVVDDLEGRRVAPYDLAGEPFVAEGGEKTLGKRESGVGEDSSCQNAAASPRENSDGRGHI